MYLLNVVIMRKGQIIHVMRPEGRVHNTLRWNNVKWEAGMRNFSRIKTECWEKRIQGRKQAVRRYRPVLKAAPAAANCGMKPGLTAAKSVEFCKVSRLGDSLLKWSAQDTIGGTHEHD